MSASKLSSKGQLVIPRDIREHLRLRTGDLLDFIIRDDGEVMIRAVVSDVRSLKGLLHRKDRRPVSLDRMSESVRKRAGRGAK